ncbi:hypothetical protein COO60DRAFT_1633480 [Scenedesmus sp. NREL 46B-D3]|nr:hypothetical protein COO60DRAFT_1633480 [Scenedesmus sp. NREL 46B-D3]
MSAAAAATAAAAAARDLNRRWPASHIAWQLGRQKAATTAIARAVNEGAGGSAMTAASKGLDYARLATKASADPWEFGRRKLLQGATDSRSDRISQALNAAHDAIDRAVASGAGPSDARSAANANLAYARLTTQPATDPWEFGRKLQQAATNSRSDLISQALSAAHDAIGRAVSAGASPSDTRGAANANLAYAKMTTQPATDPWEFGRK